MRQRRDRHLHGRSQEERLPMVRRVCTHDGVLSLRASPSFRACVLPTCLTHVPDPRALPASMRFARHDAPSWLVLRTCCAQHRRSERQACRSVPPQRARGHCVARSVPPSDAVPPSTATSATGAAEAPAGSHAPPEAARVGTALRPLLPRMVRASPQAVALHVRRLPALQPARSQCERVLVASAHRIPRRCRCHG